ncbi:hypothetical protein N7478_006392 [Penicillium angulare]|uniref:uncharacterized protein n=1 Tax=Penicillium angulare TaxID=116970 RepID=UPI0025425BF2|nr:uncharacterized protein N7478_006392 [Penicillium angulare]KAJ5281020.1 hypothetical protein N7478_006392 [Penicillium angulare]
MSTSTSIRSSHTSTEGLHAVPQSSPNTSTVLRIKQYLKHTQKKWGPLMAAKESWEDEYNFPAGRYAETGDFRDTGVTLVLMLAVRRYPRQ